MGHIYTKAEARWLKKCVLLEYSDKDGLKILTRKFNHLFETNVSADSLYRKAAVLQKRWVFGNGRRKKSDKRARYNYTPEQKDILRTCELPGRSEKSKRRWGRKLNKLLGSKCTWDALLYQAKVLRGDWKNKRDAEKKMVPKSSDTRIRVGTKSPGHIKIVDIEYALMVNGEIVWQGDCKPEIFRFKKIKQAVAVVCRKTIWKGDIGTEVVIGEKDID